MSSLAHSPSAHTHREVARPVVSSDPESHEKRARRLFDEMARNIGREAVNHLKTMYPETLGERMLASKSWETSLVNSIRNDINWRMRPLLMAMIAMHREWESEATADATSSPGMTTATPEE